ncbi:MAG: low affinity iron permease family protein [Sphingomonadales bacterium]|nr:low affinity iron permease family protein [Sphingomonadales bacterium]MDE2169166.1 low affinity iron permease family protein [Sphingomonadales bacterium]
MGQAFSRFAERVSAWTGRPAVFVLASLVVVVWGLSGPLFHYSDTWQLVINTGTTIITFLMVFVIQNSQNRDTMAIHSKLNELLRSIAEANNQLVGVEHKSDKEIEAIRDSIEQECQSEEG